MSSLRIIWKGRPVRLFGVGLVLALVVGLLIPEAPGVRGPLVDISDGLMLGVLAGLGLFIGNLYSRLGKLEERNAQLEGRIATLESAKSEALDKLAAASFINRVGLWIARGCLGPMPQPPDQIRPHIDAELWEDPAIGGTE